MAETELDKLKNKSQNQFSKFENQIIRYRSGLNMKNINMNKSIDESEELSHLKNEYSQKKVENLRHLDELVQNYDSL